MKSAELHRKIKKSGWKIKRQASNHVIYEKDGLSVSVPFNGSKEVPTGTAIKIIKEMGLK